MKDGNYKSDVPPNVTGPAWEGFRPYFVRELQVSKSYLPTTVLLVGLKLIEPTGI